jgi:hypothetical protein
MPIKSDDIHAALDHVEKQVRATKKHAPTPRLAKLASSHLNYVKRVRILATSPQGVQRAKAENAKETLRIELSKIDDYATQRDLAGVLRHSGRLLMALPGKPSWRPPTVARAALAGKPAWKPRKGDRGTGSP